MKVTVGAKMSFKPGHVMADFSSKTLNRTFDRIVFSEGVAESGTEKAGNVAGSPGSTSSSGSKAQVSAQDMAIIRTKRHWGILILGIFFLYLFPVFNLQYFISLINYLCITIIIVLVLAMGFALMMMYDGLVAGFNQAIYGNALSLGRQYPGARGGLSPEGRPGGLSPDSQIVPSCC
jgi:hypothetical protein